MSPAASAKTVVHLISEFVIELLQSMEVPEAQIEELVAQLEFCKLSDECVNPAAAKNDNQVMI